MLAPEPIFRDQKAPNPISAWAVPSHPAEETPHVPKPISPMKKGHLSTHSSK